MNINTKPPNTPITSAAIGESINQRNPPIIRIIKTISAIICPETTIGPAKYPFFKESEMVTVSIGPGTSAPDSPAANEVNTKNINSNN